MPDGWRRCHGAPAVSSNHRPSRRIEARGTTPERRREPNRHFDIAELDDYLRPFRPEVPVAILPADLDPVAGGVHRWRPLCHAAARTSSTVWTLGARLTPACTRRPEAVALSRALPSAWRARFDPSHSKGRERHRTPRLHQRANPTARPSWDAIWAGGVANRAGLPLRWE